MKSVILATILISSVLAAGAASASPKKADFSTEFFANLQLNGN